MHGHPNAPRQQPKLRRRRVRRVLRGASGCNPHYAGGGYAEYCVAPQQQVIELPEQLSLAQGAAVPENYWTVWQ